jgi:hypothetical protein
VGVICQLVLIISQACLGAAAAAPNGRDHAYGRANTLTLTVDRVGPKDGRTIRLRFSLAYEPNPRPWDLRPWEPVYLAWWDARGRELAGRSDYMLTLDGKFIDECSGCATGEGVFRVPRAAWAVSVEFAHSGLITDRLPVPGRGRIPREPRKAAP